MKKLLAILLSAVMIASVTGCSPKDDDDDDNDAKASQSEESDDKDSKKDDDSSKKDDSEVKLQSNSWSDFYSAYSQQISNGYDNLTEKSADDLDVAFEALKILNGDINLAFCATFFDKDAKTVVPMMFAMFQCKDGKYSESGNTASFEAKNSNGVVLKFEVSYDKKESAEFNYYENDKLLSTMSLCFTKEYAAKVYTDKTKNEQVIFIACKNGDAYSGSSKTAKDITLYKSASIKNYDDYVKGMDVVLKVVNGKYTKG